MRTTAAPGGLRLMTTPIIPAVPTSPSQRVKLLGSGNGTTRLWQCECGQHGRPLGTDQDAFREWELHRLVCTLRPRGTLGGAKS
jgi:hypothetical protein